MNNFKVSAEDVKNLRAKTGYGLLDCKNALEKANGCFETAASALREKYASKYSCAEINSDLPLIGAVFIFEEEGDEKCDDGSSNFGFAFVQNRTDLTAKSPELYECIKKSSRSAAYLNEDDCGGCTLKATEKSKATPEYISAFEDLITYFREPINVDTLAKFKLHKEKQVFGYYVHNQIGHGKGDSSKFIAGQKGALIVLEFDKIVDKETRGKLHYLANIISMSMTANEEANVLHESEMPQDKVAAFRDAAMDEVRASGKPENIISKIVDGQMKKFFESNVLWYSDVINPGKLDWLKTDGSGSITIGEAIGQTEKAFGLKLSVPFYKILRIVS